MTRSPISAMSATAPCGKRCRGRCAHLLTPLCQESPQSLAEVYREVAGTVMAYPMGNVHPRFWAWYMGSSNFTGAIGDFLAAIQGSNLGGGSHAAALMDRQVVGWLKTMVGFPRSASGTLVSGGSIANLVGLAVARNVKAGVDVRELGVAAIEKSLCFYGSDQIHSCHRKAMEALGLGNRALRRIPTDARCASTSMRCGPPSRRTGPPDLRPCCVIATGRARSTRARSTTAGACGSRQRRGSLVPCRRLHRRAHRHRAQECLPRRGDRTGRFGRARSA